MVCLDPFAPRAPAGDHTRSRLLLAWHAEHDGGGISRVRWAAGRQLARALWFPRRGCIKTVPKVRLAVSYLYDRLAQ